MELVGNAFQSRMQAVADKLRNGSHHLVHYTSGENALNIINRREFWLRNVRCMNDYREVDHGIETLIQILSRENGAARRERLIAAIDRIAPGVAKKAIDDFDAWSHTLRNQTYIGCLSLIPVDDNLGRLSMWRAYCPNDAGVALVMKATPFLAETDILNAYSIPVSYLSNEEFSADIDQTISLVESQVASLKPIPEEKWDDLKSNILWLFISIALGLKHPAFAEEEEWRVFFIPTMFPSGTIIEGVTSVRGIPQIVQKIPLLNDESKGLHGADIPSLIERVIVGPTEYPLVIRDALSAALFGAGVENPDAKIFFSNIPLRA